MKSLRIALLLSFLLTPSLLWAQVKSFTQSAPISISGDGLAGEKGEDEATMKAREELRRSQIKKTKSSTSSTSETEVEAKQTREASPSWDWTEELTFKGRASFVEFSWGPMFSSWSDVGAGLEDNSWVTGFSWGRFFHPALSSSIGIEFVHPQEEQFVVEEVRVFQISGTLKHHYKFSRSFSVVSGGSVLIADWNVRKKLSTANSQEVYQSFGSGSAVGLRPEAALRFSLGQASQLDLKASWTQYFGSPESDFGGAGVSLQLHLQL